MDDISRLEDMKGKSTVAGEKLQAWMSTVLPSFAHMSMVRVGLVSLSRLHIHIFAFAALGPGVSGGDKIFMECARVWIERGHHVTFYGIEDGQEMVQRYGLGDAEFVKITMARWRRFGFAVHYLAKTLKAAWLAQRLHFKKEAHHVIYSAGDSPPDVLPAWIVRRRHSAARWVAGFFFFAPTPWPSKRDATYRGGRHPVSLRSAAYYLLQQLGYRPIRKRADFVVACNQLDIERMVEDGLPPSKAWPIYGGIDVGGMTRTPEPTKKIYEGCFVGRFHAQKGVLQLPGIWECVVRRMPAARLAVIGEGSLRGEMESRFRELGLERNVEILGYLDGDPKYHILKASRVFLHTPTHDTGGMAAAEAMGCGLPVVGFDLPGYRHCYPKGMKKVPTGDSVAFADAVIGLLENESARQALAREALNFSHEWDWPQRAGMLENIFMSFFEKPPHPPLEGAP